MLRGRTDSCGPFCAQREQGEAHTYAVAPAGASGAHLSAGRSENAELAHTAQGAGAARRSRADAAHAWLRIDRVRPSHLGAALCLFVCLFVCCSASAMGRASSYSNRWSSSRKSTSRLGPMARYCAGSRRSPPPGSTSQQRSPNSPSATQRNVRSPDGLFYLISSDLNGLSYLSYLILTAYLI